VYNKIEIFSVYLLFSLLILLPLRFCGRFYFRPCEFDQQNTFKQSFWSPIESGAKTRSVDLGNRFSKVIGSGCRIEFPSRRSLKHKKRQFYWTKSVGKIWRVSRCDADGIGDFACDSCRLIAVGYKKYSSSDVTTPWSLTTTWKRGLRIFVNCQ